MIIFAKLVNSYTSLTIFVKSSILDVWKGSEYDSSRNLGHNILKLCSILEKFALTTSKEVLDVYQET